MSSYCVYKHTSPSGKVYIGITKQNPVRRWRNGFGYKTQVYFYKAILKYGWDNFTHEILFSNLTEEEACQKEIELIDFYCSNNWRFGYNVKNGGEVGGTFTVETRAKISTNRKNKCVGAENHFYGKHHSAENRERQSEMMKGNSFFKGRHHSEEFKKNKSKQMKAKYINGNSRNKVVIQYDLHGNKIESYRSLRFCSNKVNISVGALSVAIKNNRPCKGFIFIYEVQ